MFKASNIESNFERGRANNDYNMSTNNDVNPSFVDQQNDISPPGISSIFKKEGLRLQSGYVEN